MLCVCMYVCVCEWLMEGRRDEEGGGRRSRVVEKKKSKKSRQRAKRRDGQWCLCFRGCKCMFMRAMDEEGKREGERINWGLVFARGDENRGEEWERRWWMRRDGSRQGWRKQKRTETASTKRSESDTTCHCQEQYPHWLTHQLRQHVFLLMVPHFFVNRWSTAYPTTTPLVSLTFVRSFHHRALKVRHESMQFVVCATIMQK